MVGVSGDLGVSGFGKGWLLFFFKGKLLGLSGLGKKCSQIC